MTKLYAFGSNGSGQLGIGHVQDTNTPTLCLGLPTDDPIIKISGGGNHSAVLTKQGNIYMTGLSQFGEEHMKTLSQKTDQENIEYLRYQRRFESMEWKDVTCGWAFTVAVSSAGRLYGIGTSRWNELARSNSTEEWVELDTGLTDIVSVACGWRHTVALDVHGQVYGWGWGKHGQLGPSETPPKDKKDIRSVQKITMPQPIVQMACGHLHTLLRGQDGTVYAFGSDKYSQLGGTNQMSHKACWIDAGWHHSALLDNSSALYLFGRNDHGQLGCQTSLSRSFSQIACGSEHTLAILKDTHQVLAWGWNEHGNCASDKDFTSEAVVVDVPGQACILGAGCATSWIGL